MTGGGLLPHEVKTRRVIEELAGIGEEVFAVGEGGEKASFIAARTDEGRFSGDADVLGGVHQGDAKSADFVDEAEGQGLLAGPDLSGCERLDLGVGGAGCTYCRRAIGSRPAPGG